MQHNEEHSGRNTVAQQTKRSGPGDARPGNAPVDALAGPSGPVRNGAAAVESPATYVGTGR